MATACCSGSRRSISKSESRTDMASRYAASNLPMVYGSPRPWGSSSDASFPIRDGMIPQLIFTTEQRGEIWTGSRSSSMMVYSSEDSPISDRLRSSIFNIVLYRSKFRSGCHRDHFLMMTLGSTACGLEQQSICDVQRTFFSNSSPLSKQFLQQHLQLYSQHGTGLTEISTASP